MSKLFVLFLFAAIIASLGVAAAESRCSQPIESGICFGNFDRFAFDSNTGKCTEFVYGGCGGNDNLFHTLEECRSACENVP
ncbi:hypothetical protein ABMA27_011017 [Loxostege sticticalis]|uniref:BPTI/Kunitz inhibitor domain-containing protein n=1 Tax=Loxostege sticticalis TaxID=481309 RepID=A0ABR3H3R3_LOXSC